MKNWKVILGVLSVFVLGMAAGGLVTARWLKQRARLAFAPGAPAAAEFLTGRLSWELRLDADQRRQVLAIMQDTQRAMQEAQAPVRPQMEKLLAESNQKIRAVLRPEQQEQYDRLLAQRRAQWRRPPFDRGGGLRRGGPPPREDSER
jgi:Spy/CpxP family protein refolding chaperone